MEKEVIKFVKKFAAEIFSHSPYILVQRVSLYGILAMYEPFYTKVE